MQDHSTAQAAEQALLVIGLGMIGGSVLRCARQAGSALKILGFDTDEAAVQRAHSQDIIDNPVLSLAELAAQASIIVIAVPPLAFDQVFAQLAKLSFREDVVISDVASVKQLVMQACTEQAPDLLSRFLPAHPIAGSEQSGLDASRADLFANKKLIISPHAALADGVEQRGAWFWQSMGCQLASLNPALHDELLASTSHLPHVLAYVLVDSLLGHQHIDQLFEFAAGGFQDISRTASSDPTMWHDIFSANKEPVLRAVDHFQQRLSLFKTLVEEGRSEELFTMLERAKRGRDDYLAKYRS